MTRRTHHLFRVLLKVSVNSFRFYSPEHNSFMQRPIVSLFTSFLLKMCYQYSRRWYERKVNRFQSCCFVGEYYRHNCHSQLLFLSLFASFVRRSGENRRNGVRNFEQFHTAQNSIDNFDSEWFLDCERQQKTRHILWIYFDVHFNILYRNWFSIIWECIKSAGYH